MKNTISIILLSFFLFCFFSCKTTEQQVIEPQIKDESKTAEFPNVQEAPSATKIDRAIVEEVKQAMLADTVFASIQRTPCYGRCPIYEAIIYNSGYVVYKGVLNVDKIGTYTSKLNSRQMMDINAKAVEIGYFEMETQYDSPVTDLPTTITSLKLDNVKKKIKNRVGGPELLKQYEFFLEGVLASLSWDKKSDTSQ